MNTGRNAEAESLILTGRAEDWNAWRQDQPGPIVLDGITLSGKAIEGFDLSGVNFARALLYGTQFNECQLDNASLFSAHASSARFSGCRLSAVDVRHADLEGAQFDDCQLIDLVAPKLHLWHCRFKGGSIAECSFDDCEFIWARFEAVKMTRVSFARAHLEQTDFRWCSANDVSLKDARCGRSRFANLDLRGFCHLEDVQHLGPSSIDVDTLYLSAGDIPEGFLRGCGVPAELIAYLPSLAGAQEAIRFYSCFISHATADKPFVRRLYDRMIGDKVRTWFADEDLRGGRLLYEQLEEAIEHRDRLLLVLSEHSIGSEWVHREIRHAYRREQQDGRRRLFPISLMPYEQLKAWTLRDVSTGDDISDYIRAYFIQDFSDWTTEQTFEREYDRLLEALRESQP